jgi:putative N6-adenine-specific DNA methylase
MNNVLRLHGRKCTPFLTRRQTSILRRYSSVVHQKRHCSFHSSAREYFVTTHPGAEEVLAKEVREILSNLDTTSVEVGKAGVRFQGDDKDAYDVSLWSRSAIRVLGLVKEVDLDPSMPAGDTLYEAFGDALDWGSWLDSENKSFSIDSRIWGNSNFTNGQLLNTRGRDAICDAVRNARGYKPLPPPKGRVADVPLFATSFSDTLSIYLDYSGRSLHKRGFASTKVHKASLNECVAATCLKLAGFPDMLQQGPVTIIDPMCGSGTFLTEAAMIAGNIAPGLYRRYWPFYSWPTFDRQVWDERVMEAKQARAKERPQVQLYGNDIHQGALELAAENIRGAGVQSLIKLSCSDVHDFRISDTPVSLVITNPPWGQRLENDIEDAWSKLGIFLKNQAETPYDAFILSGSTEYTQYLKLRAEKKHPLSVGGTNCRLLKYAIHKKRTT